MQFLALFHLRAYDDVAVQLQRSDSGRSLDTFSALSSGYACAPTLTPAPLKRESPLAIARLETSLWTPLNMIFPLLNKRETSVVKTTVFHIHGERMIWAISCQVRVVAGIEWSPRTAVS